EAVTPYFYSTYEQENEASPLLGPKAVILGSGPIRIGQGIEFDCCCVQSAAALRERGVAPIMVNSNPETVSTDFDASARLYFDPLDEESVAAVLDNELGGDFVPSSTPAIPVLVQFGGQTALNLSERIADLERDFPSALEAGTGRVLVDKYLRGKEVEVDAVSDGHDTLVAGIMEHIERAGVHSGDSYAVYPAQNLLPAERSEIIALTRRIAEAIGVRGLLNIQFIVTTGAGGNLGGEAPQTRVWVLEVNPRASRTVPFLTKVTGVPLTRLAVA